MSKCYAIFKYDLMDIFLRVVERAPKESKRRIYKLLDDTLPVTVAVHSINELVKRLSGVYYLFRADIFFYLLREKWFQIEY